MGFEPTTSWTTTRRSNQLSYSHRSRMAKPRPSRSGFLVRPDAGLYTRRHTGNASSALRRQAQAGTALPPSPPASGRRLGRRDRRPGAICPKKVSGKPCRVRDGRSEYPGCGTETAFAGAGPGRTELEAEGRSISSTSASASRTSRPPAPHRRGRRSRRSTRRPSRLHAGQAGNPAAARGGGSRTWRVRHWASTVDPGPGASIVPGGKVTMFFAILMFGEPGAEILYPDPGFPIYRSVIDYSGAKAVPIPLTRESKTASPSRPRRCWRRSRRRPG